MSVSGCLNPLNTLAQNICLPALLQLYMSKIYIHLIKCMRAACIAQRAVLHSKASVCITQSVCVQFLTTAVDMRCMLVQTGAILYACRFPERMFPGKFDLAFSSHQLFHVCVVVAAAIHYKAIFQLLAWRDATGGAGGCLKGSCQTVLPLMQLTTG